MTLAHGGYAAQMPASGDRKALIQSGLLTGRYFFIELGVGLRSGSVTVISGAFHTFSVPFTATVMLLVKMLYVEDVLGDPIMRESVAAEDDAKAQRMKPSRGEAAAK